MSRQHDCAVIFDVDGVLLELTSAEENLFFAAFAPWGDPSTLSRNWNSYRIRNDDNIVDEVMERWNIPAREKAGLVDAYHGSLGERLADGRLKSVTISGAREMLSALRGKAKLGFATANFREAARLRLQAAGIWDDVSGLSFGADGGGHKHQILGRAIAAAGLPASRIVYLGDNLNDVEAGLRHGVHFIGFSTSPERREILMGAGARTCTGDHAESLALIREYLGA